MPNVVVWGKTRDLIAGDLPAGMPIAEVSSLAEARAQGDSRGTLLLTDPATLETHEKDLETWLRGGGAIDTLLVVVAEAAASDDVLRRFPFVHDLVMKPVTGGRLKLRLDRAFDALRHRREVRQLEEALKRKGNELSELNKIGVALSAERDINKLLDLILRQSRDITSADAGSLYLVERGKDQDTQTDDLLRFKLTQNDSVLVPFEEFTLPLSPASIAGYVALTGQALNLADAYHLPSDVPYSGSGGAARSFDEKSGYRTRSMLVVPMKDHKEEVIGVVQLINKKKDPQVVLRPVAVVDEEVIAFTEGDKDLVTSLASQAAVAYENTLLIERLKQLFDSFIRASVTTIEKRDPVTSGHSEGVAILTVDLAQRVNAATTGRFGGQRFSNEQIQEIRYASLLHDFGKVGVMEKYLRKAKKLYGSHQELIEQRFECIQRTLEVDYLEAKMRQIEAGAPRGLIAEMDQAYQARREEVHQLVLTVRKANEPTIL
ncbi:MAG TPA: GAF domain-containing protein, partial [Vicinamibacteria bacterium]|nr:GAF domain-containing protein [Vicinamibacteria bacterium]